MYAARNLEPQRKIWKGSAPGRNPALSAISPPPAFAIAICRPGARSSGIGLAWNSFWQAFAIHRAHEFARFRRALSVAIPVFAYICRYSFETNTNANRARRFGVTEARFQIAPML
jgi:hypothetical protein